MKLGSTPLSIKDSLWSCIRSVAALHREEIVENPEKDFTRNRQWTLEKVLRFLIFMGSKNLQTELDDFSGFNEDETPSLQSFYPQRDKLKENATEVVFHEFTDRIEPSLYLGKYILTAVDGSSFTTFYNPNDETTFTRTKEDRRGFNEIHLITTYRVQDRIYTDAVIQPLKGKNEYEAFCTLMDRAPQTEGKYLYLADRGFCSYNTIAHALNNNAFFLIRAKERFCKGLLGKGNMPTTPEFDVRVSRTIVRHQRKKKYRNQDALDSYRYVTRKTTFDYIEPSSQEEYTMEVRVVRLQVPNAKEGEDKYEYLVTNLPEDEFDLDDLCDLYHERWRIETSFREFKHDHCATDFHAKSVKNAVLEIWGKLVLYNATSQINSLVKIKVREGSEREYQLNFAQAIKTSRRFLFRDQDRSHFAISWGNLKNSNRRS